MCNGVRLPIRFDPWFMPDDLYDWVLLLLLIYVVNDVCVTVCARPSGLIAGLCDMICIIICHYCH